MGTYLVKEIFGPTVQGEGAHAGRACVFLRFAACNLACTWCDTDFSADGAEKLEATAIADRLAELDVHRSRVVIVTGGEPTLQWDKPLADAITSRRFAVHMETNGTHRLAAPVSWLTVSPKPQFHEGSLTLLPAADVPASECKVVVDDTVDQVTIDCYERLYSCDARFLQPCMDSDYDRHLKRTLELVDRNPRWRLSVQLHKIVGVP